MSCTPSLTMQLIQVPHCLRETIFSTLYSQFLLTIHYCPTWTTITLEIIVPPTSLTGCPTSSNSSSCIHLIAIAFSDHVECNHFAVPDYINTRFWRLKHAFLPCFTCFSHLNRSNTPLSKLIKETKCSSVLDTSRGGNRLVSSLAFSTRQSILVGWSLEDNFETHCADEYASIETSFLQTPKQGKHTY